MIKNILFFLLGIIAFSQTNNLVEYNFVIKDGINDVYKEYLIFSENDLYYASIKNDDNLNYEDGKLDKERVNFEPLYINFKTDSLYQDRIGIFKKNSTDLKRFILVEKKPVINWKITKESKKILGYVTYKATTTFRGRYYIAWFTPELPYNYGPWKLGGLPGLILKVENDLFDYDAIRIVLNSDKIPTITRLKRQELIQKKYSLKESIEFENNWLSFLRSDVLSSLPPGTRVIDKKPIRKDVREFSIDE